MEIRDIKSGDIQALAKLYYQFWGDESDTAKMEVKLRELQSREAYILLCAVENGQLLGSVMGIVCEELYGDCRPFLVVENMIVDSGQRQKGIGRALFQELEKRAISKGCAQVILVTEEDRKDACAFYESIGFHPDRNRGYKKKF